MAFLRHKAQTPVAVLPPVSKWQPPAPPAGYVHETRPDNKSEAELRGVYPVDGPIHGASKNCTNCYGDGYRNGQYCPCVFDQIEYSKALIATVA